MPGRWVYDLLYRRGAPWEIGPRSELVELVTEGRIDPSSHPRALDLGCGAGANAIWLAQHGFDVTGIDFSRVALARARRAAAEAETAVRFIQGDLTTPTVAGMATAYDLLVDYGTLDDLRGAGREAMASTVKRLARPGGLFLLWCFYGARSELPVFSTGGPSKAFPGLLPGEEDRLFGDVFAIERLAEPPPGARAACFLMTRR